MPEYFSVYPIKLHAALMASFHIHIIAKSVVNKHTPKHISEQVISLNEALPSSTQVAQVLTSASQGAAVQHS